MNTWTPDALDALAAVMLPRAVDLVCLVRDWDRAGIDDAIRSMDVIQLRTLAVVLAAMVPEDRRMDDLIAWTRQPHQRYEPVTPEQADRHRAELAAAEGVRDHYIPNQEGAAA